MLGRVTRVRTKIQAARVAPHTLAPALSCALVVASLAVAAIAPPGAMAAEGNAFNELTQAPAQTTSTATTSTSSSSESSTSNSKTVVFLALGAAVVLLIAIGYVISRDARRFAPAGDSHAGGESAFTRDPALQLKKRRAKAKAARRARKQNR